MRKQYSAEFKADVILEVLREENTLAQIASERGVHPAIIVRGRKTATKGQPWLFQRAERRRHPIHVGA